MSQEKEELQIRDLLMKLQVITYGLVEERKKSQEFLTRVREVEQSLRQKESENIVLTKANIDLQTKLSIECSKKAPNKKMATNILTELEEKTNKQEEEIKVLSQLLMEKEESFDQQNIKHQTVLVVKDGEISKLKKDLENMSEKIKKFEEGKANIEVSNEEKIEKITNQYKAEKEEILKNIDKLKKELEEEKKNKDEIDKLKNQIVSYDKEINKLKQELEKEASNKDEISK